MEKANEIKKTVADNLKKYRREKGMTQKELADEVNKNLGTNFKHNTISSWENGTNSIDTTILKLICDILEIDINTIYGVSETKKPTTIAAHLPEGVELTEEEQKQLDDYIQFILSKRKK